ncbi:MAG: hypothetical protein H8E37_04120 [Planctomycetes bacterium]|nr:hypothetical protein [Planctomycetota bacterium]
MQRLFLCSLVALISLQASLSQAADRWEFSLSFSKRVHAEPFTGRVYLIFSQRNREPRTGPSWFTPEQFLSLEVKDLAPGETLTISDSTEGVLGHPVPVAQMNLAGFRAQAVARFNPWERNIGTGPGNGFSKVIVIRQTGKQENLVVNSLVPKKQFRESKWSKLLSAKSKLLSEFYGHDVSQNASVILPASYYDEPERRYPVIFTIPGFGGDHFRGLVNNPVPEDNEGKVEFIRVLLDPSCPLGHHVFADSANNGPRGKAFTEEFLPELDRQFRTIPKPSARFLTGHSSGGWSSLWVQVAYPDHFAGVWSTSPDPVSFLDFQRINMYAQGENMYVDGKGQPRPLARVRGQVLLWYKGFDSMEWTLGPGGQLHSFEAVFSQRGENGKPKLAWDRKTGVVNTKTTENWKKYDINLILKENWKALGPKLNGKLHVYMGDVDTFYLEGATILLKKTLADLGSDAVVEIQPGKDHMNLLDGRMRQRIRQGMVELFLKAHPEEKR